MRIRVETEMRRRLPAAGPVVAGVSGGADSLALLHLLARFLPDARRRLQVVHVHHGLRGPAADRDQHAVESHCRALGVPCTVFRRNASARAVRHRLSLEEAGRLIRHECFLQAARRCGARVVAVGHHRDDQAETLLLNLLRGAGGRGLSGLRSARPFPHPSAPPGLRLIRPLLSCSKSELEDYLRAEGVRWRRDASNADPAFARNRIRNRVLPWLEQAGYPGAREHLARSADALARDDDWLETQVTRKLRAFPEPRAGQPLSLDRRSLKRLPEALRWRVLAGIWDRLAIPGKTHDHLDALNQAVLTPGDALELPGRWRILSQAACLEFQPPTRKKNPEKASRRPGFGVECRYVTVPRILRELPRGAEYVFADAEKLTAPLRVSFRRAGDAMRPLGLGGRSKTLKKIMLEMKIPAPQRSAWPILKMGREIIWVHRGPVSETVKLDADSRKAVRISLVPGL